MFDAAQAQCAPDADGPAEADYLQAGREVDADGAEEESDCGDEGAAEDIP